VKKSVKIAVISILLPTCLLMVVAAHGSCEEYTSLKGLKSVKAVFDFQLGNPQSALAHLNVIRQTFKDKNMWISSKKPEFVVIFIGPSVKLVSANRAGFSAEEQKVLGQYTGAISDMAKDGVSFEVCLVAAKAFGVEPSSVLPVIKQVRNGWISLIGYEAKGFSLVPIGP
jgi:intracellular sulfur oxidation DsrE/DsrF family protein